MTFLRADGQIPPPPPPPPSSSSVAVAVAVASDTGRSGAPVAPAPPIAVGAVGCARQVKVPRDLGSGHAQEVRELRDMELGPRRMTLGLEQRPHRVTHVLPGGPMRLLSPAALTGESLVRAHGLLDELVEVQTRASRGWSRENHRRPPAPPVQETASGLTTTHTPRAAGNAQCALGVCVDATTTADAATGSYAPIPRRRVSRLLVPRAGNPAHNSAAQLPADGVADPPKYNPVRETDRRLASRNLDPPTYAPHFRRGTLAPPQ